MIWITLMLLGLFIQFGALIVLDTSGKGMYVMHAGFGLVLIGGAGMLVTAI